MRKIDLLDYGFIRLVDHMGSDLSVVRAARVSYDAAWRAGEDTGSDTRLLNFLWRNRHSTPFEAATLTFEVKAPIFVFRQWHRHRTQSYNELSARYRELPEEYYVPKPEVIGKQHEKNKQARDLSDELTADRLAELSKANAAIREQCDNGFRLYKELLEIGYPRELARSVLAVNTYSHMFTTGNLLNFFKFIELRDDAHAQYEIRVYAQAMKDLIRDKFPVCVEAFERASAEYKKSD